jgi:hypothetical protein
LTQAIINNQEHFEKIAEAEGLDIKPFTKPMEEALAGTRVDSEDSLPDRVEQDIENSPVPSKRVEDPGKSLQMSFGPLEGEKWYG